MCNSKNVDHVLRKLQKINLKFDGFMCATVQMQDADTLPGSVSHKIDVVQGNADVVNRVNRWIEGVEVHYAVVNDCVGVSKVSDSNACVLAGNTPFRSEEVCLIPLAQLNLHHLVVPVPAITGKVLKCN